MTTDDRFERTVRDLFAAVGRPDARSVVVDVLATTGSMRQRPAWVQLEWWLREPGPRARVPFGRLLLAAALLVLATIGVLAAGAALRTTQEPSPNLPSNPPRAVLPVPSLGPSVGPSPAAAVRAWDATYVRQDPGDAKALDVVLVRPDGAERLIRRIGLDLAGSQFPLSTFGTVSQNGWLALSTTSSGQLPVAAYGLFDLAHPSSDPLTVPYPPVIGGRWSTNDLFAVSSAAEHTPTGWMSIDVHDPRTGATTALGTISLFGGGPSIVWARDGSGILDGSTFKPVGGGPNIPIDPGMRFLDRRVGMGGSTIDGCNGIDPGTYCPRGTTIGVTDRSGHHVDWYTFPTDQIADPANAIFAADGQSLLVTLLRTQGQRHQAVIVRIDRPNHLVELGAVDIPDDGWNPSISAVDPDDSQFAVEYETGPQQGPVDFHDVGVIHASGTVTPIPPGTLAGFVSAGPAESWPALSEFGPPPPASASSAAPSTAPVSAPSVDPLARSRYTPAPDLLTPRAGATAVTLLDGRVLIFGGTWNTTPPGEVFDPMTGTSVSVDMPTDVTSTARLPDGRVLMVGGHDPDPTKPGMSALFDPVTMTVTPTRPQAIPRAGAQLAPLPDGRVLMVGGEPPHADGDEVGAVTRAEIFDPATDSWRLTGSLHTDRIGRDVTVLRDGRVFVATGFVPDGLPINVAGGGAAAEIYDPETGHWTRVFAFDANSPHGHLGSPIGLVDGRVALESVRTNGNELLGYQLDFWDPRTNQFAPPVALPGLPQGHVVLDDGRLYFVGSNLYFVGSKDRFTMWSAIFDPRTNQITETGATVAWAPTPVLLDDGRVLLVGGQTDGASVITMGPDHRIAPFVATMEFFQ